MAIPLVEELKQELRDQPDNPLRPRQVAEYRSEQQELGAMAAGRDLDGRQAQDGAQGQAWLQGARAGALRRIRQIDKVITEQAPKRASGDRANRIKRLVGEVIEKVIKPAMQPRSTMRRNPPGAVGQLLRTEFHPVYKDAAKAVKKGLLALDPENSDPDFTNLERFRSEGLGDGVATANVNAQIPGHFSFGAVAKANWPEGLGEPENTAIEQVRRREATEERVVSTKRPLTEEQRQKLRDNLAKGRATQAAKRAAQSA